MKPYDIIAKKRDGFKLSENEIDFMVQGFTNNKIPDYQMAAFLMSIYIKGLDNEEISHLTNSMIYSGEQINLSAIEGIKIDKHSTGGVGDKTTLVIVPMIAAAGIKVPKISGRGLGHTGGTIDKLESIDGFNTNLSKEKFIRIVNKTGAAIIGQTEKLVPADKKIYALRDVTATVSSIPLIASSVMSKKIASGADKIVLDVKVGSGAFMKSLSSAKKLAEIMVSLGNNLGRKTVAIISNMNQPLGFAVGNSLEVIEAIDTLKDKGPSDLKELCLAIGSEMLILGGITNSQNEAINILNDIIKTGKGLNKFREIIKEQDGNEEVIFSYDKLPQANLTDEYTAKQKGYIHKIDALRIGEAVKCLGAGRITKDTQIDLSVGVILNYKVGDLVKEEDVLIKIFANDKEKIKQAKSIFDEAVEIKESKPEQEPFIYEVIK
ncbi:MAG: pyrimidine-nucleoside phosphorylase [Actinobacteria bacterium]|nr:pyrimidine-nucleoside phosphorylase [Actinomycetota bacterium]